VRERPARGGSRLARGGGSRDLQIGDGAISRVRERDRLEVGHGCERRWVTVAIPRSTKPRREAPDRRSLVAKPTAPLNRLVAKPTAKPSDQIGEVQCEKEREQRLSRESRLEREKHACFGKWFTEKFSVNHFPYFTL
jgi:hypothetical protein